MKKELVEKIKNNKIDKSLIIALLPSKERQKRLENRKISQEELDDILDTFEKEKKLVDLSFLNLSNLNFKGRKLALADFSYSNLENCNFENCNLLHANFQFANIQNATFSDANLFRADFRYIENAKKCNFESAVLAMASFACSNLEKVNFYGAILNDAIFSDATNVPNLPELNICPDGIFLGWRVVDNILLKYLIYKESKKHNGSGRTCRTDEVKILKIINLSNNEELTVTPAIVIGSPMNFAKKYKKDEIVKVENFDDDRWKENGEGIRFYLTKEEALLHR